jgi:GNAT superfamily N-acetyltransferase
MTSHNGHATGTGTGPALVRASQADVEPLADVIAAAFFRLAPCRWLIPDGAARRAILPPYFAMYVEHAMSDGQVWTTPRRDAVALWLPVQESPSAPPAGYQERLAKVTRQWLDRFQVLDAEFDRHHPAGFAHHHLAILAVRPDRQGLGIGTALLNDHHARLDQDGIPAYLEASNERTRHLYLGHGYSDHGTPLQLPDGPAMWPMVRRPKPHEPGVSTERRASPA